LNFGISTVGSRVEVSGSAARPIMDKKLNFSVDPLDFSAKIDKN
jgi:hypothetical protein